METYEKANYWILFFTDTPDWVPFSGLYFVIWGAARIDTQAQRLPFLLRLLLWPGSLALWPVLLGKLLKKPAPRTN